jgi:antitoxin (DNA-binding transcriptional repressor) of toxin-antitoxin stability system
MPTKYTRAQKSLSVREARAQFTTLIDQAFEHGLTSVVTRYDKPVAMIVPIRGSKHLSQLEKKQLALDAAAGIWSDREESATVLARRLRNANNRYEEIFD